MIRYNRSFYASASEWLEAIKQDRAWLSQLQQLQTATPAELKEQHQMACKKIEESEAYDYWHFYKKQVNKVELVVEELWEAGNISLPGQRPLIIWMLTIEWLENHKNNNKDVLTGKLSSEEAKKYWSLLQKAVFVDANCQLMSETTRQQAMYIAEVFAEKLGIKSKWKPFENLWGIKNLAQEKNKFMETGKSPSRSEEIDRIFEN